MRKGGRGGAGASPRWLRPLSVGFVWTLCFLGGFCCCCEFPLSLLCCCRSLRTFFAPSPSLFLSLSLSLSIYFSLPLSRLIPLVLSRPSLTPPLSVCPFVSRFEQVEDNRFSISVHYRNCARIDVPRVKDVVVNVQAKHERIRMGSGKEVGPWSEIRGRQGRPIRFHHISSVYPVYGIAVRRVVQRVRYHSRVSKQIQQQHAQRVGPSKGGRGVERRVRTVSHLDCIAPDQGRR